MPLCLLSRERRRGGLRGTPLSGDARRIIAAQGARALAYGLGSVLIGLTLADRGLSNAAVGLVLASLLAGIALVSVLIARYGDSFAGGFVPQTFIAYLFVRKYDASPHTLAITFFAIGILQALSFQAAVRIAAKIGLLRTMVFTHLPSNLLLIAVAFAPNLASAITLLLARFALSQMDVPTRQAYVMGVVDPSERTAAAAYTNTARHLTRPVAPLIAGATLRGALGAPFFIAGTLKSVYDLGLYLLFRDVKPAAPPTPGNT